MEYGFQINGINSRELGVLFKKNTIYNALLQFSKRKQPFSNNWIDEDGFDYDDSETGFEAIEFTIDCFLVADNADDLMFKRANLIEIFTSPHGFLFHSERLNVTMRLRYIDSPSFRFITPIWRDGKIYCHFQLMLQNNYDESFSYKTLTDNHGNLIVDNEENKIIVKSNYDSRYGR